MTSGIIEILIENAGVQALVGLTPDNAKYKVFPIIAEEKDKAGNLITSRYISVWQGSIEAEASLTKDLPSMLDYPRFTVACWDKNFRPTELMAQSVRLALEAGGIETNNGYLFNRIWLVDHREIFDPKSGMYGTILTFAAEVKRVDGSIFEVLVENNFMSWGGYWNWAAHGNALPTDVRDGRVWLTEDDRGVPGDPNYYPADTLMIATSDDADDFNDFTFNLA